MADFYSLLYAPVFYLYLKSAEDFIRLIYGLLSDIIAAFDAIFRSICRKQVKQPGGN